MAGFLEKFGYQDTPNGRTRPTVDAPPLAPRARVDAASTTDENRRHWGNADSLGPNAAFDPLTRSKLRNRGRYEWLNNSYCRGLGRTTAYDLIGTGPRLQLQLPRDDSGARARAVERSHARWARAARLPLKFRTMEKASFHSGGCFGLLDTNPRLANPVKLDVRLVEVDQCHSPFNLNDPKVIDGVRIDDFGNPVEYYFLKYHPGELYNPGMVGIADVTAYTVVPAEQVLHWREIDRPGQIHSIPKITSSLPLFSQLRRIRLATLTAMEFASMVAGIMKTNVPPAGDSGPMQVENWSLFEMVRGALLTLPEGWAAEQFRSEHPNATFEMMNREILNESGRGVGAPLNVVTGNSSGYNFSSGRLDHLPYHRSITIDRDDFRTIVLDPTLAAWEAEARMIGEIGADVPDISEWDWAWNWDGFDSIDQLKDATADSSRIKDGTSTYAEILAAYGQDWQAHFDQLAREKAYAESKGLPWPILAGGPSQAPAPDPNAPDSPEQAVALALESVGLAEDQAAEILDALAPMFAALRPRNGYARRNGHPILGGRT